VEGASLADQAEAGEGVFTGEALMRECERTNPALDGQASSLRGYHILEVSQIPEPTAMIAMHIHNSSPTHHFSHSTLSHRPMAKVCEQTRPETRQQPTAETKP